MVIQTGIDGYRCSPQAWGWLEAFVLEEDDA